MLSKEECTKALNKYNILPIQKLVEYIQLVLDWNEKINVTGSKTVDDFVLKHVLDTYLANKAIGGLKKDIFDVGSGGGIPGIILAILNPSIRVNLVERRVKKAGVLSDIVKSLKLDQQISVIPEAFEKINPPKNDYECWFRGFLPGLKLGEYFSDNFDADMIKGIVLMKGPAWKTEKADIINSKKINKEWVLRFAESSEIHYNLPDGSGTRSLVLL